MRVRRRVVVLALAGFSLLSVGCGLRARRLVSQGRYAEAVQHVESKRRYPHRKGARAYAYALIEVGRAQEARGVLLRDFRRGGQLPSLIMLADLEAELGLRGIAAAHYARLIDLDRESLEGRTDVCSLLRDRARVLLDHDEALAAEVDLRRVDQVCAPPPDAAARLNTDRLARQVDEAADAQVKRRIANTRCRTPNCAEEGTAKRISRIQADLRESRLGGPASILAAARRLGAEVQSGDLLAIITAELRGELGRCILADADIRLLAGAKTWSDLAPSVGALAPEANAWVQLRLSTVITDMPVSPPPPLGPSQQDRWAERAAGLPGAQPWRAFAWRGDLAGAELALASTWRARVPKLPAAAPAGEKTAAAPAHWGARVVPSDEALAAALVASRLRAVAGQEDLALEVARFVLHRSSIARVPSTARQLNDEVARSIAWGQPWHALAIADAVRGVDTRAATAAAASAVMLTQAFCGGTCRDDGDYETVARVMGQPWVDEQRRQLDALAFGGSRSHRSPDGCPTPAEVLAPDASSTLAQALRSYRDTPDGPGVADQIRAAVEEDITLVCAARYALPVMADARFSVSAGQVSEALAYDAGMSAASQLVVHAQLSGVAGEDDRAELLSVAAGSVSIDPIETWSELARFYHRMENRTLELTSWREVLFHRPGLQDDVARRELVVLALRDLLRSWGVGQTDSGREAAARDVSSYLAAFAPEQRQLRRRELIGRVQSEPWAQGDGAAPILEALYGDEPRPKEPESKVVAEFDVDWLVGAARGRSIATVPTATALFADPARLGRFRLALSRHSRDYGVRWRMAIGLMIFGDVHERTRGAAQLLELAESVPHNRAEIESILLEAPAALAPSETGPAAAVVIGHDDLFVPLWMGLDLAPALLAR